MRLLFGMVLGALMTVGLAYFHDSFGTSAAAGPSAGISRPMVNWDVVESNWNSVKVKAHSGWTELKSRVDRS